MPGMSAQEGSAIPARLIIPDGTPIDLRLAESVCSAHAHVGDVLNFIVVKDVSVGGFTVIPAGTVARGSVTGVKGRRLLGIGGQVSLKLDSVALVNGDRVGLRASKEVKGGSRTKLMVGAMIVTGLIFLPATPVFLLTRGRSSTVVKSTEITAQVDGDTSILEAGLPRSPKNHSELGEMMDYLPPRVFNAEGREGDMVNLVFVGQQKDLQEAFQRAGWVRTDKWRPAFVWHLLRHGTSDKSLPMARFYLFGRIQDYSYALPDPDGVVSRRHHLRIWKTDSTVDGTPVWAGAATHDIAIEIAKRGRLINHRIDPEVDAERDFIGANLTYASAVSGQEYLRGGDPVFLGQTTSGQAYHSDSRILLLNLQSVIPANNAEPGQTSAVLRAISLPTPAPTESFRNNLTAPR
ncbi:MAG: LssY C-terminal domain-containing protein [Candidatus Korobacteraceae bacterium]